MPTLRKWAGMVTAISPLAGLAACVLLHVVASRLAPAKVADLVFGVAGGGLMVVQLAWRTGQEASLALWFATYLLLAYCYVIGVFNLGESSRRIRLLIELYGAPDQTMTQEEIRAVYNARMVVKARLERLVAAGQLIECDHGRSYVIGNRTGLRIARMLAWLTPVLVGQPPRTVFIADAVVENFRVTRRLLAERLQRRR